ncbi:hypothetical protein HDU79_004812 [Rhizoclosmatium sp. JEL0117]|nr:hypothetical protein HDU79_004812 [Rhizoclosmatium sp. JEL0117]
MNDSNQILEAALNMRMSIHSNRTSTAFKASKDGSRSITTLRALEATPETLEVPGRVSISQPKAMDLHEMLLQEQREAAATNQRALSTNANMNVIEQAQSEIRRKNKKLAEEEFSSLLHTSRNKKLHTKNIMILERTDEVVKEKRWVRDLNEKERMGKVVADLEVRDSHAVQESLKLAASRQEKEIEIEVLKKRRAMSDTMSQKEFKVSDQDVEMLPIDDATPLPAEIHLAPTPDPNSSNPRNWPRSKKWRAIAFASLYTFISPISSSMVAPALPYIAKDLKFTQKIDAEMSLSIFVLAYALGPLFLAPLSEIYGRKPILQASLWFFVLFNAICGLSEDKSQMLLFRFLAGLGGSAPISLSGSVVADCFNGAEMGQAMSYYALGIVLAPALGPILGGYMTQGVSWHWLFYSVSIVGGVLAVFGTFFFPETYAPVLAARERKERGEVLAGGEAKIWTVLKGSITRPIIMLFTQPIVMVIALIMAFVYGVMYIVLSTFSLLFMEKYGENTQTSSLHYLALAVGLVIGSQLSGPLLDKISKVLQKKYNTPHKPEYRLPICIPGSVLLPIGLFLYGWAAENTLHWIWLDIGIALFAMSVNLTFQSLSLYTVDVYHLYSASALAAVSSLRSLAGFGFPLFAGDMYDQMGYGWGNSMLAILGIVIGIPAPILLYIYGERIRAASKFGSG